MSINDKIKIKPFKDSDSWAKTHFLKTFFWLFAPLFFLSLFLFGFTIGLILSAFVALIGAIVISFIGSRLGNAFKSIYGGREAKVTSRELLECRLKAVRVAKMENDFKNAIDIANEILKRDSEFYEAMFVKAQILAEGFGNTESAKKYARKIMNNTKKGETIYNWAESLHRDLSQDKLMKRPGS